MSTAPPISIGDPLARVDGVAKVTGSARYAAEFRITGLTYASVVLSTVASGRIVTIDRTAAEHLPGVIAVITPENAMRLAGPERRLTILQDDEVFYQNQPVAVIVAETLEQARFAASRVMVRYETAPAILDFEAGFAGAHPSKHNEEPGDQSWGNVDAGLAQASTKIDQVYTTPIQHHNPMEPHATIAQWDGKKLSLHDATQHITGVREKLAAVFGIPKENVSVDSPFTGGGFGCKGQVWSHVVLAALAAKQAGRPVKLVMERPQMFGPVGARPRTHQRVSLGVDSKGKLTAIRHEVHANTSMIEDYLESAAFPTRVMYACPNISTTSRVVTLNLGTPTYMRAPGVATGTYAIEVAMDEMSYALNMDPLEFRLLNYAEVDPHSGKAFTEKNLRECYKQASTRFGWSRRNPKPRSMREGRQLIGLGMATETYPGKNLPAAAMVSVQPNGRVLVASGTQEIGTGNYTIMTEVAAAVLGVPASLVDARLGDTSLPEAPTSAGSMSTASVMPAVKAAAEQLQAKLRELGGTGSTPGPERFGELIRKNGGRPIEATAKTEPRIKPADVPCHSFGAVFAEVAVDEDLGMTRVRRIVAVYDVGRIVNRRTANSQFIGGIVWGISLALHEVTEIDWRYGRITNPDLASYLVPVNADVPWIDATALDIPDYQLDSVGARGIGEIGITGTGAAVANAIFHATGKRVRELPITPDKLISI
jgi:xanthine dehydrogenase YagR molybdenum-binding subunit